MFAEFSLAFLLIALMHLLGVNAGSYSCGGAGGAAGKSVSGANSGSANTPAPAGGGTTTGATGAAPK